MYIKTQCPVCGDSNYHNIRLRVVEEIKKQRSTFTVTDAEITDTVSEEELAHEVMMVLSDHLYNGISTNELCKILKDKFGILARYCCDIIQQLKIEMDMYCPDRQHLYFV
ncbi:hypothetical protein [Methanolobus sp.]|jgi:hypothetical protein|uniref:hypothetical protein n=1 Tax=Methanolobus sp. TaxID=1874737 RepID=UPI0025D6E9CA|nr:hypothetical protein [Methanolobus sp.]